MEFVAHRAGNGVPSLRLAQRFTSLIEIDVHAGRDGRLEARHAKSLWPTSRLWERWYLLPAGAAIVPVSEIVAAAAPATQLWLDLKGVHRRIAIGARAAVQGRSVTVSSKSWWLLRAFEGVDGARTLRSAGNRLELALLQWLPSRVACDGAVVHSRLLTDGVIRRLRRRGQLFTWHVTDVATIERLARLGVDGVIVDDLELIDAGRAALDAALESDRHDHGANPDR